MKDLRKIVPWGRSIRKLTLLATLLLLPCFSSFADTVIVESRSGGQNFDKYSEMSGVGGVWANSSAKATVAPCTTGIGCRYGYTNSGFPQIEGAPGPGFSVSPVLAHAGPEGVYKVEVTMASTATSASSDIEVSLWFTNCTGSVVTTKAGSPANTTTNFQYVSAPSTPLNTWRLVGYITNDVGVTQPTIGFQCYSGTVSSTKRFFADAVLFTYLFDLCKQVPTPAVNGPLAAGQNFVNVQNVVAGATSLKIYKVQAGSPPTFQLIGQTSTVVADSVNAVPLSASLSKGDRVIASQTKDGIESCLDVPTPSLVGGGANPANGLRLAFNVRETNVPPVIGANGGTFGDVFFIGSSDRVAGKFGAAPSEGAVLASSTNWQTVTFTRGLDPASTYDHVFCWSTVGQTTLDNNYGVLDGLALAINDTTDTGPYAIYIGKIINGSRVIQDFSAATNGEPTVMFSLPGATSTSAQNANLLAQPPGAYSPNLSLVVNTNGGSSGKSLLVNWQWNNTAPETWVQLLARGSGTPNPIVDLRQPIQAEILILPTGATAGNSPLDVGTITNQAVWAFDDVTLRVPTTKPGLTYQWYQGNPTTGYAFPDGTNSTYTLPFFNFGWNGLYTVTVSDGTRTNERATVLYSVDPIPTITNQPASTIATAGGSFSLHVGADPHNIYGDPINYQWRLNGADLPGQNDKTLAITGAGTGQVGAYDVYLWNTYGYATSAVANVSVVPANVTIGAGTGLLGSYWTARTNFTVTPTLTRNDPVVDFSWAAASPAGAISADTFTARWAGQVQALGNDTYTFHTVSDDGVRLWVNGAVLIDNWTPHGPTTNSATITLAGTGKYDLALEYFENTGGATIALWWSTASGSIAPSVIPASQLFPAAAALPAITLTSPTNGASIEASAALTLSANVDPYNNFVSAVEFFRNGIPVSTNTTAPYTSTVAAGAAGTQGISARIVFNGGGAVGDIVYSATNSLTVIDMVPPTISGVTFTDGKIGIGGTGPSGKSFVLFETPALSPAAWTPVQTNSQGVGTFNFTVVPGANPRAFYRVGTQ